MNRWLNYILLFCAICISLSTAYAQISTVDLICEDTTMTRPLIAEVDRYATVRKLVAKDQFKPEDKEPDKRNRNSFSDLINNGFFTSILYLLAGGLLITIVFILIKHLKPTEVIEKRVVNLEEIEDIAELNVNEELEKALADGDLRLAVRIQYLRVLQRLSEDEAIRWKPRKTNSVYVSEMRSHQLFGIFKMITRNYDYIWYGKREVTADLYHQWLPYFDSFFENKVYGE